MKTESNPAAGTPFEKFRQFTQKIVSVPKAEIDRREKKYQQARAEKKKRKGGFSYFPFLLFMGFIGVCGVAFFNMFNSPMPRYDITIWGGLIFVVLVVLAKYCRDEFQCERQRNKSKANLAAMSPKPSIVVRPKSEPDAVSCKSVCGSTGIKKSHESPD
jgi:hypothetical protein